ncbi:MAG: VWA domain-containing protein [Ruminococcus flavefaciens]|nr:VWA domain-containing protein [Ruminococcus flavefaciens]MCM1228745.1 VWA domain-containing protein [Ruminococcus flavefaciens]
MKKRLSDILALSMTLPVIACCFASCGDDYADYSSSSMAGNYYTADKYYDDESYDSDYIQYDEPSNEEYRNFVESGFKSPEAEPLSTFSADVDTASYSNARRFLNDGTTVPVDSVRIEEFINYFDYNYDNPDDGEKFSNYIEIADCPWNKQNKLMMIGIQGDRMKKSETPPSNLVFLIDSSGSMSSYDKLPLVQQAFSMLAENLTEYDRISIVTYAGTSDTRIAGADGTQQDEIIDALYSITASGGTNGEGGIEEAYRLAEEYFIEDGNNRVILATDGDLNIGASSEDELVKLIETKRDKGIYLSVLGFGTGNYKDARLEAVADNGNGNYSYIDSVDEARRVLVEEMNGTLFTIAKDMKIQVEFNPAQVKSYRLVGYDNRIMNAEDFYDNTKDAGEVGAGHSVTALYEIELADSDGTYHGIELEFAEPTTEDSPQRSEICKLSVTYKNTDTNEDIYTSELVDMEAYNSEPTDKIRLAGAVAEFAMLLKVSDYRGDSSFDYIVSTAENIAEFTENERVYELAELADIAGNLYK